MGIFSFSLDFVFEILSLFLDGSCALSVCVEGLRVVFGFFNGSNGTC